MAAAVKTVADVLARLKAIDAGLPPSDGVKWFNKLYLEVTQQVEKAVPAEHQAAAGFLAALDVVFAARYFAAFDAAATALRCRPGIRSTPGSRCSKHVLRPASRRSSSRWPG
jgi:hypothetical protein